MGGMSRGTAAARVSWSLADNGDTWANPVSLCLK